MRVNLQDIRDKMAKALAAKGFSKEDSDFLIEMYLGGELRGHTSHGLASFPGFVKQDFSGQDEPEIVKSTDAAIIIDAKSNPGALVGKHAADEAIARAQKQMVGVALIKNMDSWLRPGAIAQYIAEQGYMTLVFNDGGGTSIAPPGGFDPVLATNPIAYGIPTKDTPLVVDMATSKRAWGQVRLANKYGTSLPKDTFYNNKGEITLDPKEAHSVLPFGEYKGFALALMVEILCGSLVGMDSMMNQTNQAGNSFGVPLQERGGFILVVDPGQISDLEEFKKANSELVNKIKATSKLPKEEIRIPGEEAGKKQQGHLAEGTIDLPEELWQEISNL